LTAAGALANAWPMETAPADTGQDLTGLTFEDALRALEDVVRKLESGEVPLDESISLYERGELLRRHCQARLDAAQARIEKIVAAPDGRAASSAPFDAG
jgi:exodeoxyribonuclease VII small subunit